jgi:hypothetical protein
MSYFLFHKRQNLQGRHRLGRPYMLSRAKMYVMRKGGNVTVMRSIIPSSLELAVSLLPVNSVHYSLYRSEAVTTNSKASKRSPLASTALRRMNLLATAPPFLVPARTTPQETGGTSALSRRDSL